MNPGNQEFHILACIGKGGFGEVYRAQKVVAEGGFRKDVALKMLHANMATMDDVARRLKDEARILGMLNHRAIVKVDLLAVLDGRWTVVMEYIEGADLKEVLRAHGPLPLPAVLEIGSEVAGALDYAYNHQVEDPEAPGMGRRPLHLVHRDIKPSNIQLTPHGDVKVLDFGIAKAEFESREAVTGKDMFLTREYAAPERLNGIEHPNGDVFSLGVVLYELLTGRRLNMVGPLADALFGGQADFNLREYRRQRKAEAREVLEGVEGVSSELLELLLASVAWDHTQRPSARELQRSLKRFSAMYHAEEAFADWCERVVGPVTYSKRAAQAAALEPKSVLVEPATLSGNLAGKRVVTDGNSFRLVPAATSLDREPVAVVKEPTSAESMEKTRWGPGVGAAGAGSPLPPQETTRGVAAPPTPVRRESAHAAKFQPSRQTWLLGTLALALGIGVTGGLLLTLGGSEEIQPAAPVVAAPAVVPGEEAMGGTASAGGQAVSASQEGAAASPEASPEGAADKKPRETGASPTTNSGGKDAAPRPTPSEESTSGSPWGGIPGPETETPTSPWTTPTPPPPKPASVPKAQVTPTGDAEVVHLIKQGKTIELRAQQMVPPGNYEVRARWPGGEMSPSQGELVLKEGTSTTITCKSWPGRCQW